MALYHSASDVARATSPENPVFCRRPHAVARAGAWFCDQFRGRVFYAVKANPADWVLQALWSSGVHQFDVASLAEVRQLRGLFPAAELAFMHPIKPRAAIAEAYRDHGVRIFALDSVAELHKILSATGHAGDLTLLVRLGVSSDLARIALSAKFGVGEDEDVALLTAVRAVAARIGVCFHVGSQAMSPKAFAGALDRCRRAVIRSGVIPDIIDVGGGFPSAYPGMETAPLADYLRSIHEAVEAFPAAGTAELWCEPGRALCAEGASLIVRVDGRRGDTLFINDGLYGALYDAGALDWPFPVRALSRDADSGLTEFSFYGPTCDDDDFLRGPFFLPDHMAEGDFIEVGMLGAYGATMSRSFNGFGTYEHVTLTDDPMMTMYTNHASGQRLSREGQSHA